MENLDLFGNKATNPSRTLKEYFGVSPFSVLDTCSKDWRQRKKKWDKLIGDNGKTRGTLIGGLNTVKIGGKVSTSLKNISLLDAVLAELIVKWFTEDGFRSFDPFAGDTVFGFVSAFLNRPFEGIELREEQAVFNQEQCDKHELNAKYFCDSSENMNKYIKDNSKDFVFSCPPYADLEVYSDLEDDLSTMNHEDFFIMYSKILQNTYKKLKNNRFAVIVTSEVRNKKGEYIQLVSKTIDLMVNAGYIYYNDIILLNSVGNLMIRVGKQMNSGRKIGRRHQNVLVFYKGDPKEIKNIFSELIPKNERFNNK